MTHSGGPGSGILDVESDVQSLQGTITFPVQPAVHPVQSLMQYSKQSELCAISLLRQAPVSG